VRTLSDYADVDIRLTEERLSHIERRPEMTDQLDRIEETLQSPDDVRVSDQDESVVLYHRRYANTPVTEKILLVVVKRAVESPFVITAFFTDRLKSGAPIDDRDREDS
jgi:hypothetical protein